MLRHTGMCPIFGSFLFCFVLFFLKEIPKHGFHFSYFSGFAMRSPDTFKNLECFCGKNRKGIFFLDKSLNMGTYLGKNTPEHRYGSRAAGGTSPTNPNLRTPWALSLSEES